MLGDSRVTEFLVFRCTFQLGVLSFFFHKEYPSGFNVIFVLYTGDDVDKYRKGNFIKQIEFVKGITKCLHADNDDTNVGMVTYADTPDVKQNLHANSTQADLEEELDDLKISGKRRHIGKALQLARRNLLNQSNPNIKGKTKIVVVLTDGASDDDLAVPSFELKRENATIFSIGINRYKRGQLNEMASEPNSEHVFTVDDYDGLGPVIATLKDAIIKGNIIISNNSLVKIYKRSSTCYPLIVQDLSSSMVI